MTGRLRRGIRVDATSYVKPELPRVSVKPMSSPEQGQNRTVGRSQENASTLESAAVTVSSFLQGLARSLLSGRETGLAYGPQKSLTPWSHCTPAEGSCGALMLKQ